MLPNVAKLCNSHHLHTEITVLSPHLSTGDIDDFFAILSPACHRTGTAVFYVSQAVVR